MMYLESKISLLKINDMALKDDYCEVCGHDEVLSYKTGEVHMSRCLNTSCGHDAIVATKITARMIEHDIAAAKAMYGTKPIHVSQSQEIFEPTVLSEPIITAFKRHKKGTF